MELKNVNLDLFMTSNPTEYIFPYRSAKTFHFAFLFPTFSYNIKFNELKNEIQMISPSLQTF